MNTTWKQEKSGHYTVSELATFVGVSPRTIRRWLSCGNIPKPAKIASNGYNLWTPTQARKILKKILEQ